MGAAAGDAGQQLGAGAGDAGQQLGAAAGDAGRQLGAAAGDTRHPVAACVDRCSLENSWEITLLNAKGKTVHLYYNLMYCTVIVILKN